MQPCPESQQYQLHLLNCSLHHPRLPFATLQVGEVTFVFSTEEKDVYLSGKAVCMCDATASCSQENAAGCV